MSWERAIDFVLQHEGGFVDDPDDPGGATNMGISLRFLKDVDPALADIDGDGDVDADDIRAMTRVQAVRLYRHKFWDALWCPALPDDIALLVFDTGVNMGRGRAARLLQRSLNRCAHAGLVVDGRIGPVTAAAARAFAGRGVVERYLFERAFDYCDICRANPVLKKYLFGWLLRLQALGRLLEVIE